MPGWLTNGMPVGTPANYTTGGEVPADTYNANGSNPQSVGMPVQAFGQGAWTTYTAAGASQGTATALTSYKNLVTVALTASTKGVKLPTPVTGLAIWVGNNATFGVKVYAGAAGQTIAAGTTATTADPTVLAINKVNCYLAVSATKWIVYRGA